MSLLTEDDILPALELLMAERREASDNHTNPKMQAYYGALATGVGTAIQEIRRLAEEKQWMCRCGYAYGGGIARCVKCGAYKPNSERSG